MTKNKAWKRVTAAVLALMLVSGTVPVKPIAELVNEYTAITAYADETETLLTTITGAGSNAATATSANVSYSTEGVATLTFSGAVHHYNSSPAWGWWGYGWTATVTPAEGYTITKCVFYDDTNHSVTDSLSPFVVETTEEDKKPQVNDSFIYDSIDSHGITKIEVYGYATPAVDTTSVYTAPTAVQNLEYNGQAQALVTEGTASDGATMKYAVVPEGKKLATKIVEGDQTVSPVAGAVYRPTGLEGIWFDYYHIKYDNVEYSDGSGNGNIYIGDDGKTKILGTRGNIKSLPDDCNAIYVKSISGNVMTVEAVNTANCVQAAYGDTATATNAGDYTVYYKAVRESDGSESEVGSVTATIAKADATVTAANNLTYDGTEKELVTAPAGVEVKYGVPGETVSNATGSALSLNADDIKVGAIYSPTDRNGIVFPSNYTVKYKNKTCTNAKVYKASSGICALKNGTTAYDLPNTANAVMVTDVTGTKITVVAVNTNNPAECIIWSPTAPKGTNAGTYTVYYKIDGSGNYNAATGSVNVEIAKGNLVKGTDYTAPEAKSGLIYNGSAQKLLTAGAIDAAKGTMEYGTKASPVERDSGDIYNPVVGDIIKPSGWNGVNFPTNWSLKIGDDTYAAYSDSQIGLYVTGGTHNVVGTNYYKEIKAAWGDHDAFMVTAVDSDNKTVTIEFIDPANVTVWSTEVPEETDAGTYDVMWRIKGADGYNDVEAQTITATIAAKKDLVAGTDYTAPEAKSGLIYNGSAQKLLTAGAIDAAKGTMEYGTKASPVERDTNDIYDPVVGDVIKPSGWYGVCFPTDWSVKIGDNTYAAWSESKIYLYISDGDHRVTGTDSQTEILAAWGDHDAFRVTAVDSQNSTVTIEFVDSANAVVWSTEVPEETDAGTYDVMWRIKGADGYNDVEAQTITATIAKADITPTVSISDWTYGETASTPTVTGNTGNGTVSYQYAVKGSDEFSDGVPTDAGDYTVKATVAETKNYNGASATADFKITKADITPTVSISDWTYGKTASTPTVTGNSGNGTVSYQYAVKGSDEFSDGVPTDAGDYTVKATVAETKNYNGKTVTADFKINKAAITITADDKSSKYKSDIAPLTYQVSGDYVVGDELNIELSTTATNTSPVGEYDIVASYNNDNYDATLVNGKYTITKADLTTSATGYSGIYDGKAHSISVDVGDSDAVVYYGTEELTTENYKTAGSTENPAYTNAGEYTVYYFIETPNYDPQPVSGSKTVVIEKADAKFTAPTANKLTYNGKEQALITEGKVEGGTFVYALGEDAENSPAGRNAVSEVPTGKDAGTYYVWYKVLGDENHNDTEAVCVTVKINRLSIKDAKVMVRNKTYTGKALKPGSKVVVNGKRLKKGTDYTITYKNNKNVGVGKAVIKGIGNYTGKVTTEFNIRPKKAAIKSVSSPKAKQLKVTWKKTPQATGYNIKVSTSKDFKTKNLVRNAFVKNNSTFSKTFAPLKSGKTYYVKIRAYKQTNSGKIYGQYSAVKTIKVK